MSSVPQFLIPTAKVLAILLAFFVLGEQALRVQQFGLAGLSYKEMESQVWCLQSEYAVEPPVRDPSLMGSWGWLPNTELWAKGVKGRVNNLGFQGPDRELRKAPDTFRIAVLGNSIPLGPGVPWDDSWTAVFERALNARLDQHAGEPVAGEPKRYEVFNLAMPLARRCLERHGQRALYFQPDLVIWSISRRSPSWLARYNVRAMAELAGSRSIPFLAYSVGTAVYDEGNKRNPYFELLPPFGIEWGSENYIYPGDPHPDGVIHGRIAERVLEHFTAREEALRSLIARSPADCTSDWSPPEPIPWSGARSGGFWTSRLVARVRQKLLGSKPRAERGLAHGGHG